MATATPVFCSLGIKTKQPERLRCDTHCEEALRRLQSRLDLCDVVLIVGSSGKRIPAHRFFLNACSKYFSDLFRVRIGVDQQREVTIRDVNGDAMEKLINYCYTGRLDLEGDTIESLLITANRLRFRKAVEGCCEFLQRHLQPSNCLEIAFLAEQLNLKSLLHSTQRFMCAHFEEISNQPKFLVINAEQLSKLIASTDLCTPSEEFVFEVVMQWIEYEPETRRKHFANLLAKMRLSRLSHSFLLTKVEPLCNEMKSLKLITKALKSHPDAISAFPRRALSDAGSKNLLVIKEHEHNLIAMNFNLETNFCTVCNTPINRRNRFAVASIVDKVMIVGGESYCGSSSQAVLSLNLSTMTITGMGSMRAARSEHAVAVLNGSVYAIGGISSRNKCLNLVEKFDCVRGIWISVASMKQPRISLSTAVLNDHLYVSGGYTPGQHLKSVECYDPVRNVWSSLASMRKGRYAHGFAAYKDHLFVLGGGNNIALPVERYDPGRNTWTDIPCSACFLGYTRCTSLGSDLFVYNDSKIYMMENESSCDHLQFREIVSDCSCLEYIGDFVALPFEVKLPRNFIQSN